jgi:hypothetical protein
MLGSVTLPAAAAQHGVRTMKRVEPSISWLNVADQPAAIPRPAASPVLHRRLRVWLFVLTWMLAAVMGLAAFLVNANWEHLEKINHPEFTLPLFALCFFAGLIALRPGWVGVLSVVVAAGAVAAYLAFSTPHLTGGFYFALFVVFCGLASAYSLRRGQV